LEVADAKIQERENEHWWCCSGNDATQKFATVRVGNKSLVVLMVAVPVTATPKWRYGRILVMGQLT
jgi:hypothetical protein